MKRVCIITPGNVSSNPRVVKEADALVDVGYDVRVIAGDIVPWVRERDATILSRARWRYDLVRPSSQAAYKLCRTRSILANKILALGFGGIRTAVTAHHALTKELEIAAAREPADLYVAHYTGALPAAFTAARRHRAIFGFDAEDFHVGEFVADGAERRAVQLIEQTFLPQCSYITAASPRIADAYARSYNIPSPISVLNVFPLEHAPIGPTAAGVAVPGPSLYWFSQTMGPDRGLETIVAALALARSQPHLYLRGADVAGFSKRLYELAREKGVHPRLHFLEPAAPAEMERLAADYDIGIAGEVGHIHNRRIALSNKLFSYILAGIPVVASAIPAHADLASALGSALTLYEPDSMEQLASAIDALLLNPDRLNCARHEAWRLGQERFNWEHERGLFVGIVERVLAKDHSL
jgi:glycosyltransferase involved in cell wall biosynthesis